MKRDSLKGCERANYYTSDPKRSNSNVRQMGMCPLVRNQANKRPCTQTIELWARQSCSLLDFGNKPINKHLASDLEDQTKWLALIDKKVRSASLQLVWRVRSASRRRSYSGHGVSSKQETSGSSCTSRLIIFEEHPSDTQRVPYGGSFWNRCILPHWATFP